MKWPQLHQAAYFRYAGVARLLLQNLTETNGTSACDIKRQKERALHIAAGVKAIEVAKVLIEYGTDVHCLSRGKSTVLHAACQSRMYPIVDMVKFLCQYGVDVNAVNNFDSPALHYAAMMDHYGAVEVLIQNGADVNHRKNHRGETWAALNLAVREGNIDVVKLLIKNGADVNIVDQNKFSILHCAVYCRPHVSREIDEDDMIQFEGYAACIVRSPSTYLKLTLQLICCGAKITENNCFYWKDRTEILGPIEDRLKLLRDGNPMGTTLMSEEERRFMWNLAFFFTWQYRVAAFKAYYAVRSFITYNGIFMGPGYDLGPKSIWRNVLEEEVFEDLYW
eukprot:g4993.t1